MGWRVRICLCCLIWVWRQSILLSTFSILLIRLLLYSIYLTRRDDLSIVFRAIVTHIYLHQHRWIRIPQFSPVLIALNGYYLLLPSCMARTPMRAWGHPLYGKTNQLNLTKLRDQNHP